MNVPDRLNSVQVPEGAQKIIPAIDEKVLNAASYRILREDHTLGNMLRTELLRDPNVKFAAYQHPHPLDNDIVLKVHASSAIKPTEAVAAASDRLELELRHLQAQFRKDVQERRLAAQQFGA